MNQFWMNGYRWRVVWVDPTDRHLIDRTGKRSVATTDPASCCICLSNALHGGFLLRVFVHELGHAAILSFGLLSAIHKAVYPEYWVAAEEWICNFMADYGMFIFDIAYDVIGDEAWQYIPVELERLFA